MRRVFLFYCITVFMIFVTPANAQTTSADFSTGGSVKIGPDTRSCTSGLAGSLRWNSTTSCMEYCDGTNAWTCADNLTVDITETVEPCDVDPTCPNPGDTCSGDGSGSGNPKFVGCFCYYDANSADDGTCKALYVTQSNLANQQWSTTTGNQIVTDDYVDGRVIDSQIANSTTFPAFKACKDLTDGGYSDWYLPARDELYTVWLNRTDLGFTNNTYYWTASESTSTTTNSWYVDFTNGGYYSGTKTSSYGFYCIRRD